SSPAINPGDDAGSPRPRESQDSSRSQRSDHEGALQKSRGALSIGPGPGERPGALQGKCDQDQRQKGSPGVPHGYRSTESRNCRADEGKGSCEPCATEAGCG